ncbi:GNAT family N-acetyltransferase [Jonesia quinghaiensis]|uniref:GNAT family N-acetyltransferase n=1 Tax=Jonesia quinghaiensis TaxID=262806 RepID=UPI0004149BF0|nr:GNAT family protein [Jonesia quinghaiensis]
MLRSRYWPVTLREEVHHQPPWGAVTLRPLKRRDDKEWRAVRAANVGWLGPWEASSPVIPGEPSRRLTFAQYVRSLDEAAKDGDSLPWVIDYNGQISGQLSVMGITLGSLRGASIGYWVSQEVAGRSITPLAVAMAVDYCFFERHLHRIEVNIRPENTASLRVAQKLGLRDEGIRERFLHINGRWADHRTFALTSEEVPQGLVHRLSETLTS